MRNPLMTIDAGGAVLLHRLVGTGGIRGLLGKCHLTRRVTAATFCGVVGFQFRPDLLRQLRAMGFIFFGCIEFAAHMSPNFGIGLNMTR